MISLSKAEVRAMDRAAKVMEKLAIYYGIDRDCVGSAKRAAEIAKYRLAPSKSEKFLVMFMDSRHKLISSEILFGGTIDGAAVYIRTVMQRALELNAAAMILAHNHPSGGVTPSESDKRITEKISVAAKMFDIRVLDHIIVGGTSTFNFAECSTCRGYLSA